MPNIFWFGSLHNDITERMFERLFKLNRLQFVTDPATADCFLWFTRSFAVTEDEMEELQRYTEMALETKRKLFVVVPRELPLWNKKEPFVQCTTMRQAIGIMGCF